MFFFIHLLILLIFFGLLFIFLQKKYQAEPLGKYWFWGFLAKLLAGYLHAGLYFFYYQEGDLLSYHRDSTYLAQIAVEKPLDFMQFLFFNQYIPLPFLDNFGILAQPRALFMLKFNACLYLLSANNIWVVILMISFLNFWLMWLFANELCKWFPAHTKVAAIAFLFFPSVLLWSAGINKESFALIAMYGILYCVFSWKRSGYLLPKNYFLSIIGIVLSSYLLLQIKFYYLAVLLPCLFSWVLLDIIFSKYASFFRFLLIKIVFSLVFFILLSWSISLLNPEMNFDKIAQNVIRNHNVSYIFSSSEDVIQYYKLDEEAYINLSPTLQSWLVNAPLALISGLFRPFVWEAHNKVQLLASLENLFLALLCLYAFIFLSTTKFYISPAQKLLLIICVLYIIILAILLAFSTPNLGSLNRFRVSFMPFFLYLVLIPFAMSWAVWKRKILG